VFISASPHCSVCNTLQLIGFDFFLSSSLFSFFFFVMILSTCRLFHVLLTYITGCFPKHNFTYFWNRLIVHLWCCNLKSLVWLNSFSHPTWVHVMHCAWLLHTALRFGASLLSSSPAMLSVLGELSMAFLHCECTTLGLFWLLCPLFMPVDRTFQTVLE